MENSKLKTYRCQNDDCPYFKKKRYRKPLFRGVIGSENCNCYASSKCDACGEPAHFNVKKEAPITKKLDVSVEEVQNFLGSLKKNASH